MMEARVAALGGSLGRSACNVQWDAGEQAYRCRTCQTMPVTAICVACFNAGDHADHDYQLYPSFGGGSCDCGTPSAMKPSGFCSKHRFAHRLLICILSDNSFLTPVHPRCRHHRYMHTAFHRRSLTWSSLDSHRPVSGSSPRRELMMEPSAAPVSGSSPRRELMMEPSAAMRIRWLCAPSPPSKTYGSSFSMFVPPPLPLASAHIVVFCSLESTTSIVPCVANVPQLCTMPRYQTLQTRYETNANSIVPGMLWLEAFCALGPRARRLVGRALLLPAPPAPGPTSGSLPVVHDVFKATIELFYPAGQ